jgi:hypothetical protein
VSPGRAFAGVTLLPAGGAAPEDGLVDAAGRVCTGLADGRVRALPSSYRLPAGAVP